MGPRKIPNLEYGKTENIKLGTWNKVILKFEPGNLHPPLGSPYSCCSLGAAVARLQGHHWQCMTWHDWKLRPLSLAPGRSWSYSTCHSLITWTSKLQLTLPYLDHNRNSLAILHRLWGKLIGCPQLVLYLFSFSCCKCFSPIVHLTVTVTEVTIFTLVLYIMFMPKFIFRFMLQFTFVSIRGY